MISFLPDSSERSPQSFLVTHTLSTYIQVFWLEHLNIKFCGRLLSIWPILDKDIISNRNNSCIIMLYNSKFQLLVASDYSFISIICPPHHSRQPIHLHCDCSTACRYKAWRVASKQLGLHARNQVAVKLFYIVDMTNLLDL